MQDASFWFSVLHAALVVKCVFILLLFASIVSWTIIIQRTVLLRQSHRLMNEFERLFGSGESWCSLKAQISCDQSVLAKIFHAGFDRFQELQTKQIDPHVVIENSERTMRIIEQRSLKCFESNISVLATIGSTAPYVGLFGTVWGILTSFQSLGGVQQATLAMVAPGISEALIATAIGLFTAIPAVIAYNRLSSKIDEVAQDLNLFQEKLIVIMQKQLAVPGKGAL